MKNFLQILSSKQKSAGHITKERTHFDCRKRRGETADEAFEASKNQKAYALQDIQMSSHDKA